MSEQNKIVGALGALEELRVDSKIGKSKHFSASDRKMFWHRVFGIPVILANLFVGIVLVNLQSTNTFSVEPNVRTEITVPHVEANVANPKPPLLANESLALLSIFLAFGAASLSGIQTFFNFHKASEGHRSIGNRYVHISRQCKAFQQKHRDIPFSPEALWAEYEKLYVDYNQINTEAEAFTTSSADLRRAKSASEISPYKNPHV
ncbi:SLATT domain-containing protein [Pseudomonas viridiflava]|uniref:SLATT domain-containing protein n=1 Tax=Pseudomonas viridiflava TaxID=33069 RepID=UPI000F05353B|nr:SLATT domain-containing protein [Pseudomonas viridiflava]